MQSGSCRFSRLEMASKRMKTFIFEKTEKIEHKEIIFLVSVKQQGISWLLEKLETFLTRPTPLSRVQDKNDWTDLTPILSFYQKSHLNQTQTRTKPDSNQTQIRLKPDSNQAQARPKPEPNQTQTRLKPGSNQTQTRIKPDLTQTKTRPKPDLNQT